MHYQVVLSARIVLTLTFFLITGCGADKAPAGASSSDAPTHLVYTVESNQVHAYSVTREGDLKLLQSDAWSAPGWKDCIATSKAMAAIYVCNYKTVGATGPNTSTVALLSVHSDGTLGPASIVDQSVINHFEMPVEDAAGKRAVLPFEQPCIPSTDPGAGGYPFVCPVAAHVYALNAGSGPQLIAQYGQLGADYQGEFGDGTTTVLFAETQTEASMALWVVSNSLDHSGCIQLLFRISQDNTSTLGNTGFQGFPCPTFGIAPPLFTQLDYIGTGETGQLNLYQDVDGSATRIAQGPLCHLWCSVQFLGNSRIFVVDQWNAFVYGVNGGILQQLSNIALPTSGSVWNLGAMDQTGAAGVLVTSDSRHMLIFNVNSDSRISIGKPFTTAVPVSLVTTRSP
jgi:hypothetical protein